MADPLDKYRRPQGKPNGEDAEDELLTDDGKTYVPYRAANRVKRLAIRRTKGNHRSPAFIALVDVIWDDSGEQIGLVYNFATFRIKGKNLQELAVLLASERVASIREFDPARWERPAAAEPIIESIEVHTKVDPDESKMKGQERGDSPSGEGK